MSFIHSKGFKYVKNLIIGVGAAVVLLGALEKINSTQIIPGVDLITIGLVTEAFLFLMLGLIPPEKEYYWEKLYPGLDDASANVQAITPTASGISANTPALNGEVVEQQLGGMLTELQGMSRSLGSLKALQEVDFSGTSDQIRAMNNFYSKLNEAMADLGDSLEDTRRYKEQMTVLNRNLSSLNGVYGNVLNAMTGQAPRREV
ncbi:MAG: gliding motility protein GldL [Bacteroidota bacterium]